MYITVQFPILLCRFVSEEYSVVVRRAQKQVLSNIHCPEPLQLSLAAALLLCLFHGTLQVFQFLITASLVFATKALFQSPASSSNSIPIPVVHSPAFLI